MMAERARIGFWFVLALSWVVAVAYMWEAMNTIPTAERLEASRVVGIPTPRTFVAAAIFSAMEAAVVLAALWPWRADHYATRMGVTALALVTWFIMTTPMDLSRLDGVHRRWLAFQGAVVILGFVTLLAYRAGRRILVRQEER